MTGRCEGRGSCPARHEALPRQGEERLVLCVIRFINAAYDTGDLACAEAGHARAEAARGILEGTLLVARATAVVRLLRAARPGFAILPPCSRWLSDDEQALMRFLREARPDQDAAEAPTLVAGASAGLLAAAAHSLILGSPTWASAA